MYLLRKHLRAMKSCPKFKLTAFLVQLTIQSSQILKHNKAEKKKNKKQNGVEVFVYVFPETGTYNNTDTYEEVIEIHFHE